MKGAEVSQNFSPPPPPQLEAMEGLSHRRLFVVADNFLRLDSHPVRPVHTTTLSNDMTDKVLGKWLHAVCGNMERDKKKPFVLDEKAKAVATYWFQLKI